MAGKGQGTEQCGSSPGVLEALGAASKKLHWETALETGQERDSQDKVYLGHGTGGQWTGVEARQGLKAVL